MFYVGYDDRFQQADLIERDRDGDGVEDQLFTTTERKRTNRAVFLKFQYLFVLSRHRFRRLQWQRHEQQHATTDHGSGAGQPPLAASGEPVTVLYDDAVITVEQTLADPTTSGCFPRTCRG